jgi:putative ABC transport system permease protein
MIRLQGISYVWRSLRRAPVFSAAVILTLTIGIGSAASIFAVVNAVLLRPLPYGHPDRLVGA